jgi:O-antigen ligase
MAFPGTSAVRGDARTVGMTTVERRAAAALLIGMAGFLLLDGPGATVAGGLALLAGLSAPRLALISAYLALPLVVQTRPLGPLAVSASELLVLAAAAGTVARLPRDRRPLGSSVDLPTALLLVSALLSLLVTEYFRLSLRELRTLILEPVLSFYLLLYWFPGRAIGLPLAGLLAGAVGIALAGLVGLPFGWGTSPAEGVARLQALYPSANHLGLLLGRTLPWLIALAWLVGRWRWLALSGAAMVVAALAATFSLGAWLGSGAAVLFVFGALGGRRLLALAAGGASLVGLAALALLRVERVWSHLQPGSGTSFFRLQVWQSAGRMVHDHPLLGVGLDNFLYLYQQDYILPGALAEPNLSHPHNFVLHFWLQLGLAGLVAALWLIGSAFWLAWRTLGRTSDPLIRALVVGAIGSLIDFLLHGSIDNSYFLPDLALVFWLTVAIIDQCQPATMASYVGRQRGDQGC